MPFTTARISKIFAEQFHVLILQFFAICRNVIIFAILCIFLCISVGRQLLRRVFRSYGLPLNKEEAQQCRLELWLEAMCEMAEMQLRQDSAALLTQLDEKDSQILELTNALDLSGSGNEFLAASQTSPPVLGELRVVPENTSPQQFETDTKELAGLPDFGSFADIQTDNIKSDDKETQTDGIPELMEAESQTDVAATVADGDAQTIAAVTVPNWETKIDAVSFSLSSLSFQPETDPTSALAEADSQTHLTLEVADVDAHTNPILGTSDGEKQANATETTFSSTESRTETILTIPDGDIQVDACLRLISYGFQTADAVFDAAYGETQSDPASPIDDALEAMDEGTQSEHVLPETNSESQTQSYFAVADGDTQTDLGLLLKHSESQTSEAALGATDDEIHIDTVLPVTDSDTQTEINFTVADREAQTDVNLSLADTESQTIEPTEIIDRGIQTDRSLPVTNSKSQTESYLAVADGETQTDPGLLKGSGPQTMEAVLGATDDDTQTDPVLPVADSESQTDVAEPVVGSEESQTETVLTVAVSSQTIFCGSLENIFEIPVSVNVLRGTCDFEVNEALNKLLEAALNKEADLAKTLVRAGERIDELQKRLGQVGSDYEKQLDDLSHKLQAAEQRSEMVLQEFKAFGQDRDLETTELNNRIKDCEATIKELENFIVECADIDDLLRDEKIVVVNLGIKIEAKERVIDELNEKVVSLQSTLVELESEQQERAQNCPIITTADATTETLNLSSDKHVSTQWELQSVESTSGSSPFPKPMTNPILPSSRPLFSNGFILRSAEPVARTFGSQQSILEDSNRRITFDSASFPRLNVSKSTADIPKLVFAPASTGSERKKLTTKNGFIELDAETIRKAKETRLLYGPTIKSPSRNSAPQFLSRPLSNGHSGFGRGGGTQRQFGSKL